ncbi:MAG: AAA family ATPase [Polyangiaceae bacterium]|nr:AAA family ATPase [Polyangiaceae bacterium]
MPDDVQELRTKAKQIADLINGELDLLVTPESLFDIDLRDERAVQVEVKRLGRVLGVSSDAADAGADAATGASAQKQKAPKKPAPKPRVSPPKKPNKATKDQDEAASADAGAPPSDAAPPASADPELLTARLELDRARLDFLELPEERRKAILKQHADRVEEAKSKVSETAQKITATEETRAQAEAAQRQALEQAAQSKTEILRLLNEERARLLGVRVKQADYEKALLERENKIASFGETKLEWQRKTEEHVEQRKKLEATSAATDKLYFELRTALRKARDELRASLDGLSESGDDVPSAGPDKVQSGGVELDRDEYDTLRETVVTQEAALRKKARDVVWRQATAQLDLVEALNKDRLAFFALMSADQKSQLTSFSTSGWDQARAELAQVSLVVRFHIRAAVEWLKAPTTGAARGVFASIILLKLVFLLGFFVWWRRRADKLLELLEERAEEERAKSSQTLFGRWGPGGIAVLRRVRTPLETLLVLWLALSFIGSPIVDLLEVQVLWIFASWILGGSVAVLLVDALASRNASIYATKHDVAALRLRTLRVLGRVIVFFGLVLTLSSELVGRGTLHDWVLSTCWFIGIPLALVFVGWWRDVIFERLAPREKRSALAGWVVTNQTGYKSFMAAALGGGYLLFLGVMRIGRDYLTTVTLVRKVLAYLFRRELTKKAESRPKLSRIPEEQYFALSPETEAQELVQTAADAELEAINDRIAQVGGGVFAIVGERGSGKTTLVKRVLEQHPDSTYQRCPTGGTIELLTQLKRQLKLTPDADNSQLIAALDGIEDDNALIVDDAHRLVKPTIGGLQELDEVLALARDSSRLCTWVFVFDSTMFELVERARGTRPIFDDVIVMQPWREESIAELLEERTNQAGLEPSFEGLIEGDFDGDEIEHAEQLAATKRGYYRLLWDYSAGNPAIALHFWRKSLGIDDQGELQVGLFRAPPTADLEQLPDAASFVLRAIVRLDPATVDAIADTTRLPLHQVLDAVRYADFRGYLVRDDEGRLRITWTWFRAVTRVLSRRHLLNISL